MSIHSYHSAPVSYCAATCYTFVRPRVLFCAGVRLFQVYIEDLREEFVTDFVFEAVKANAIYEGRYLLGTR